jgi:hypothetical protein
VFGNVTAVPGGSALTAIAILTVMARPTPPPENTSPQAEMDFHKDLSDHVVCLRHNEVCYVFLYFTKSTSRICAKSWSCSNFSKPWS